MEIKEKFLPIGTVVLLKGGTKKAMITGFCSIAEEDKTKVYDYSGCVYPEGYLSSNQICLFDHDQIDQVFYMGYVSDEEKEFKAKLKIIADSFDPTYTEEDNDNAESDELENL